MLKQIKIVAVIFALAVVVSLFFETVSLQALIKDNTYNVAAVNTQKPPIPKPRPEFKPEKMAQRAKQELANCKTARNGACRDICSTSFVLRPDSVPKDCGRQNVKEYNALLACLQNAKKNNKFSGDPQQVADNIYNNVCILKNVQMKPGAVKDGVQEIKIITNTGFNPASISIPQECNTKLNALITRSRAVAPIIKAQTSQCTDLGAVVCYYSLQSKLSGGQQKEFTCVPKDNRSATIGALSGIGATSDSAPDSAPVVNPNNPYNNPANIPTESDREFKGAMDKSFNDAFKASMQKMLSGMGSGGGAGGSPYGGATPHKCDNYYYRIWNKEECTAPQQVSCILLPDKTTVAPGEKVTLKWEVTGAVSHNLDLGNISDKQVLYRTSTSRSVKETLTFIPEESGSIRLSATGLGDNNTCTQEISITVTGDPVGDKAGFISCSPSILQSDTDTEINIRYKCPSDASYAQLFRKLSNEYEHSLIGGSSAPAEISTTTDNISVPALYTLRCLGENDSIISKHSCSVYKGESVAEIIAYPSIIEKEDPVRISWASLGMSTCKVEGPNNFKYEYKNGDVLTYPFANSDESSVIYTLTCASEYGGVFSKDVSVKLNKY